MQNTKRTLNTISVKSKKTFYESVILKALESMNRGSLLLTRPNGENLHFGSGDDTIKATIRIRRPEFYKKCFFYGDVGFGEAYIDGDWETDNIRDVISWFLLNVENSPAISGSKRKMKMLNLLKYLNRLGHILRDNSLRGSRRNINEHYDLSNEFYARILDPGMTYSSAYFTDEDLTLEEAQTKKYDRLCSQLQLNPSDHVLEIGSGWGGFAIHAARRYGCKVTTVTISLEQFRFAQERIRREGLTEKINILLQDYRTLRGSYDKIVSIEMLEAVGHRHMETFFSKCNQLLKKNGLMGLQVITSPDSRYDSIRKGVDFIQKHIFPGSLLPSIARINQAINRTGDMSLHDLKDFGAHYAKTLQCWKENLNGNLESVQQLGFDDRFIRKWNYYFSYCTAAFLMRNISVMQMIYTRPNNMALATMGEDNMNEIQDVTEFHRYAGSSTIFLNTFI